MSGCYTHSLLVAGIQIFGKLIQDGSKTRGNPVRECQVAGDVIPELECRPHMSQGGTALSLESNCAQSLEHEGLSGKVTALEGAGVVGRSRQEDRDCMGLYGFRDIGAGQPIVVCFWNLF